jgi:molybdate transport system permease protein
MTGHLWLSFSVGIVAVLLSLPFGIGLAWLFERTKFRGRDFLQTLVMLPLVLPPAVTGILLLWLFSPQYLIGKALIKLGMPVAFHWAGAVVAAAVVGFPLLVSNIALAIKTIDPRYEMIARSLGDSSWQTFWRITFPLATPGILAGVVLSFARGLGEFGATIILAGRIPGETDTLSLAVYAYLDAPGHEREIVTLTVLSILLGLGSVLVSRALERYYHRRLEIV